MGRRELNNADIKPDQQPTVSLDTLDRGDGEIVKAEKMPDTEYAEELAFMEEPVTILLTPPAEKNPPNSQPVWVNGEPAKVLINDRWVPTTGYLPMNQPLTVRRKVVEVLLRSKVTRIETVVGNATEENPRNEVQRFTTPSMTVQILRDTSPKGQRWAEEMMRRNY